MCTGILINVTLLSTHSLSAPCILQVEISFTQTVVPIVPLAVIPINDGLCNGSKTNATQPECVYFGSVDELCVLGVPGVCVCLYIPSPVLLLVNMDPVLPTVPSVIVTVIVIAGFTAGIVAIPLCVWLKRRKKNTAPVGGAQNQGK